MQRRLPPIELTGGDRRTLQGWAGGGDARLALRAKLILLAADGASLAEASRRLGCSDSSATDWRKRFLKAGAEGLLGAPSPTGAGRPSRPAVKLDAAQRSVLEGWAGGGEGPKLRRRARIILMAADGLGVAESARRTGSHAITVAQWRKRFAEGGPKALLDRRPQRFEPEKVDPGHLALLARWARGIGAGPRLAARARAVLPLAQGRGVSLAARSSGLSQGTAYRWLGRFLALGPEGLLGLRWSGRVRCPNQLATIAVDRGQRALLEGWARGEGDRPGLDRKAKVILLSAGAATIKEIVRLTGAAPGTVAAWRDGFLAGGVGSLTANPLAPIALDAAQRAVLEGWARGEGKRPGLDRKAKALLLVADGAALKEAARLAGVTAVTMASWRRRFLAEGPGALASRRTVPIALGAAQRAVLEGWARGEGDRPGLDLKARAVLLGADGVNCKEAARLTGAAANTVASWRKRFLAGGLESLASKAIAPVALGAARRAALEGWAQGGGGPGLARKAKALLLLADGASLSEAARRTGVAPATVFSWRMALIAGEMGAQDHPVGRADPPPPEPERAGFALAGGDRLELEGWVRDGGGKGAMAERAKIVLSGADGMDLEETARRAGVGVRAASFWWRRFSSLGLAGLRGTRARGPRFEAEVAALLSLPPPGPRRRWTALAVARVLGVGPSKARAAMLRLEPFSGKGPAAGPGASPPDGGGGD